MRNFQLIKICFLQSSDATSNCIFSITTASRIFLAAEAASINLSTWTNQLCREKCNAAKYLISLNEILKKKFKYYFNSQICLSSLLPVFAIVPMIFYKILKIWFVFNFGPYSQDIHWHCFVVLFQTLNLFCNIMQINQNDFKTILPIVFENCFLLISLN